MDSSILGESGGPVAVFTDTDPKTGEQRAYRVTHLTQEKKARWQNDLKAEARAALAELKEILTEKEFDRQVGRYVNRAATGGFGFYSDISLEALGTSQGGIAIGALLFGCKKEEMADLMERRGAEVRILVKQILVESGLSFEGDSGEKEEEEGKEKNAAGAGEEKKTTEGSSPSSP